MFTILFIISLCFHWSLWVVIPLGLLALEELS